MSSMHSATGRSRRTSLWPITRTSTEATLHRRDQAPVMSAVPGTTGWHETPGRSSGRERKAEIRVPKGLVRPRRRERAHPDFGDGDWGQPYWDRLVGHSSDHK